MRYKVIVLLIFVSAILALVSGCGSLPRTSSDYKPVQNRGLSITQQGSYPDPSRWRRIQNASEFVSLYVAPNGANLQGFSWGGSAFNSESTGYLSLDVDGKLLTGKCGKEGEIYKAWLGNQQAVASPAVFLVSSEKLKVVIICNLRGEWFWIVQDK